METYWQQSKAGKRVVLIAEYKNKFAGYLSIVWESGYPPFKEANIPEIVDFNVLLNYQRLGIGSVLMDEAEEEIAKRSNCAGIGVGLMSDYGKAQILYVKRGYVPDGRGVFKDGYWLKRGEEVMLDDDMALYFTKSLISKIA